MPLDPIQKPIAYSAQWRDILCQQDQPERQHPDPENRQDTEEGPDDGQHAGHKPDPAEPGAA